MKKLILKGIVVATTDPNPEQLPLNRYYYVGKKDDGGMVTVIKNSYFGQTEFPTNSDLIGIKIRIKTKKSEYDLAFRDYPKIKEIGETISGNVSYFKIGADIGDEVSIVALPLGTISKLFPGDAPIKVIKGIIIEIVNDIYKIQVGDEYTYLKRHCFINNTYEDVKEVFNIE